MKTVKDKYLVVGVDFAGFPLNLGCIRTQFKLVSDVEKQYDEMKQIVNKY